LRFFDVAVAIAAGAEQQRSNTAFEEIGIVPASRAATSRTIREDDLASQ
jgi:hypothetical protein